MPTIQQQLRHARVRPLRGLHSLAVAPCAVCQGISYLDGDDLARYVVGRLEQAGIFHLAEFALLGAAPVLMIYFGDGPPARSGEVPLSAAVELVRPQASGPLVRYFVGYAVRLFDPAEDVPEDVARLMIDSILEDLTECWSAANMEAVS